MTDKPVGDTPGAEAPVSKAPAATRGSKQEAEGTDQLGVEQFVTFHLGESCFAFPIRCVLEIIRACATSRVPLTPTCLVGLANLRGTVLPVVDLRALLGLPGREVTDASRVVVVDVGGPVGLMVDRVARVLNVESRQVEATSAAGTTGHSEVVTGVIKDVEGVSGLVQLLDIERLLRQRFAELGQARTAAAAAAAGTAAAQESDEQGDTSQLVSFLVDGQEYGCPIADVQEIVRVPDEISRLPRVDSHVLGIVNLRDRLLPLVDLRRLFHLPQKDLDERNRVLVLTLGEGENHERVGLVVDSVREVLRVDDAVRDHLPTLLSRETGGEISEVCRLEDGKRLVCVVRAADLFSVPEIRDGIAAAAEGNTGGGSIESRKRAQESAEDQLVVFQLAGEEYGVTIDCVQEIVRVPEEMRRVPHTPEYIDGLFSLRGMMLPVLDMRARFSIERIARNDRQRILVLNIKSERTGFIVDSVSEVLRLPQAAIEDAPRLSASQSDLMGRLANLPDSGRMITVLNAGRLVQEVNQPVSAGV